MSTEGAVDQRSYRLSNIDMLRGLVIVIMAIDHLLDYFHDYTDYNPMDNQEIDAIAGG